MECHNHGTGNDLTNRQTKSNRISRAEKLSAVDQEFQGLAKLLTKVQGYFRTSLLRDAFHLVSIR